MGPCQHPGDREEMTRIPVVSVASTVHLPGEGRDEPQPSSQPRCAGPGMPLQLASTYGQPFPAQPDSTSTPHLISWGLCAAGTIIRSHFKGGETEIAHYENGQGRPMSLYQGTLLKGSLESQKMGYV